MKENFLFNLQKIYGISKKTTINLQKKVGLNIRKIPLIVKNTQKNYITKITRNKKLGRDLTFKINEILNFNKKIKRTNRIKKNVKNRK